MPEELKLPEPNSKITEVVCYGCKNLISYPYCIAFPKGIAQDIRDGKNKHIKQHDGQEGRAVYSPIDLTPEVKDGKWEMVKYYGLTGLTEKKPSGLFRTIETNGTMRYEYYNPETKEWILDGSLARHLGMGTNEASEVSEADAIKVQKDLVSQIGDEK